MAKLLRNFGEINNSNKCISELKSRALGLQNLSDDDIIKKINKYADKDAEIRYFDYGYKELGEFESGRNIMWISSGCIDGNGDIIYFQFTGGVPWVGALVGTESEIKEFQEKQKASKLTRESLESELGVDLNSIDGVSVSLSSDEPEQKVNKNSTFLDLLYSKLLIPSNWDVSLLDNYINICLSRLNNCIKKGKDYSNYLILNEDCTLALVNSGLLDKYGKYIMIIVKVYSKNSKGELQELGYTGLRLAGSKINLCKDGFSKQDLNKSIERVSFISKDVSEMIFSGVLEDFDLGSWSRLSHCITERRDRFPVDYQNVSEESIYSDIIKAIEIAIELNKYDHNYIKPFYNRSADCINYIIPYHVGNNFQKKPELGIVIAYMSDFWQIMTVLDYEAVKKDIKVFNMYENETF